MDTVALSMLGSTAMMEMEMKTFTAVQLAREMKLTPKRVRSILRKEGYSNKGRWVFPLSDKMKMKEQIRNARKRSTRRQVVVVAKKAVENRSALH